MATETDEKWDRLHQLKLGEYALEAARYSANDRRALIARHNGEPLCYVTVNLVDEDLAEDEFFVQLETRKRNQDLFDMLLKHAEPTGEVVSAGYVEQYAEKWRLR